MKSEIWISPSTPSITSTRIPYCKIFVTFPSTTESTAKVSAAISQGFLTRAFKESFTFFFSGSSPITLTLSLSPTLNPSIFSAFSKKFQKCE